MAGLTTLSKRLAQAEKDIAEVRVLAADKPDFQKPLKELEARLLSAIPEVPKQKDWTPRLEELETDIKRLRNILSYQTGGGNANRAIRVGGDPSTLGYFTDINFKAGSGVTLTVAPNSTTKFTDITVAATGSGSGITRSVSSIATSQTAGASVGVDYVYVCKDGIQLTMPAAADNGNLYTIKNAAPSSVLVSPDGSDTIDGDSNLILVTQYTSVDLVSDGVDNWNIT